MGEEATCGGCDYRDDGFVHRCYEPAPYRAEFRWLGDDGEDYEIPVCPRHAADARTQDSLKRIYTAASR
jgi:hypothetical protein